MPMEIWNLYFGIATFQVMPFTYSIKLSNLKGYEFQELNLMHFKKLNWLGC